MRRIDITGKKFGRLQVIECLGARLVGDTNKRKRVFYLCKCDCGNIVEKRGEAIRGGTMSCGCVLNEMIASVNYKHGEANKTKENKTWQSIQSRCYCKTNKKYPIYGQRGIKVCDRWLNSYEDFLSDMGRAPSPKHSIDRIDVNGDYEPNNCRWATAKEQGNNTRTCVYVDYMGDRCTLKEVSEKIGMNYKYFHNLYRYKNLTIEQIVDKCQTSKNQ